MAVSGNNAKSRERLSKQNPKSSVQLSVEKQINKMSNEGNNFEFLSRRAQDMMMSSHFNQAPHAMPCPTNIPWNAGAMPWTMPSMPVNEIIEFKGQECILGQSKLASHCKRKSDVDSVVPRKQLITEEKMAAHLNGLHISSHYVSHNANQQAMGSAQQPTDISMDTDFDGIMPFTMTAKELEEKINSGGRLVISEEIKKLTENEEIIPKVLLDRIERPCKALVLWQPPSKRNNFLLPTKCFDEQNDNEDEDDDDDDDGNNEGDKNSSSKDSNTMDLDI